MSREKQEVLEKLCTEGVVRVGQFPISSHPEHRDRTSRVYFNIVPRVRGGPGSEQLGGPVPEEVVLDVGQELWQLVKVGSYRNVKRFAAVSEDIMPYVEAMVAAGQPDKHRRQPVFHFAEKPATETQDRMIVRADQGAYEVGDMALLVEGVMVSAHRTYLAIQALRKLGLKVTDVLVIVDRRQGGADELRKRGVNVHSLFTGNDLLECALKKNLITHEDCQRGQEALGVSFADALPPD